MNVLGYMYMSRGKILERRSLSELCRRLSNGSDISSHGSSSSSSSKSAVAAAPASSIGGVNVALARMEYQQKVNQLNLSNTLNNRAMQTNNRSMMSRKGDSEILPNCVTVPLTLKKFTFSQTVLVHQICFFVRLDLNPTLLIRTANVPNGTSSLRAISKSNSASSLIHGNNNGLVDNVTG